MNIFTFRHSLALATALCLLICNLPNSHLLAQGCNGIEGNIFNDYNANSQQNPLELGLSGITIQAYNNSNALIATATSDNSGDYTLSIANGTSVRLEFSNFPSNYQVSPTANSGSATSSVRFITAPNCDLTLGLYEASNYCQDNPQMVVSCYVTGDPIGGGNVGNADALVAFPFSSSGMAAMP
ncbi:MAG: SdrD B-like domain-containing protein, partial [Chitinophagales bacterium]